LNKPFENPDINLVEAVKSGWTPLSPQEFGCVLKDHLDKWREEKRNAVWLHVPIALATYIPEAAKHGFTYHHALDSKAVLSLWMCETKENKLPPYASHQVGVAGFVLREDTKEVLVIRDRFRFQRWKFPGGVSDRGEDIADTAVREVFEETGVKTAFQSVLALRQMHNIPGTGFGKSDFYFICRLTPLTFDIDFCREELLDCVWMRFDEFANDPQCTNLSKRLCSIVSVGLDHGFDAVDIKMDQLDLEILPGRTYKLYHRPLPC
jgi:8-oxo-dGTP pyrophosphatase MutT (NUDIX family)